MATRSSTPECDRPVKRQKLSPHAYFEDASKEVRWPDIKQVLTSVEDDNAEPGWIAGQVFMIFASRQKRELQIRSPEHLQLKISISCPEYDLFKFSIGQSIKVSLHGACMSLLKGGTSAPGFMPFHLVFKDGAAIKFLDGKPDMEDGDVVDSWQVRSKNAACSEVQQTDDWYISSPIREESASMSCTSSRGGFLSAATSSSPSSILDTPGKNEESFPLVSSVTISNGDADEDEDLSMRNTHVPAKDEFVSEGEASLPESSSRVTTVPMAEYKGKKAKKRDTRHENRPRTTSVDSDTDSHTDSRDSGLQQKSKLSRSERKSIKRKRQQAARQRSPSPPNRNPALDLVAGISSETGAYPPLDAIRENQIVHVIGVVVYTEEPTVTQKGDFKITITLADPSNYGNGLGFKITCFASPQCKHLLPSVPKGHVLLLRDVKASGWLRRINGTVYSWKLKWSAYNPDSGKVYYPDGPGSSSPGSFNFDLDAFYQPRESEIQYFAELGEWWRAKKEEEEHGVIQIAEFSNGPSGRHCLIGTCDVNVFFNATVELLRIEEADSDQITLFFTDYTPHPLRSVEGYYGQWGMHASTSRIDPTILDIMKPGQYWTIKNMRLKNGSMNSLEADLYSARFYEILDEEDDIYLPDLLIRKQTYLKDHPHEVCGSGRSDVTESSLSDISESGHVNLVAELLYRVNVKEKMIDLYVTDYTENPSLSSFEPNGLKRQLDGMPVSTLQISAWDGHELVRNMEIGSVYTFADVRIVRQHDGSIKGNLKFADKRITRMNVKQTDNPAVLALLERKKECTEKQLTRVASGSFEGENSASPVESQRERKASITVSNAIRSRHTDQPKNTIKEIKSIRKCPNKFRLIARIVDFFPLDISDFTVRICTNCDQRIPDRHNACLMCEDMMGEYVKWIFRFFFQLEDEEGERIIVDAYSEAKHFLLNITPCDLKECHDVLSTVKRRLQDCLGNLVEVHEGLTRQELVEAQYSPFFDLAIKSWEIEDGNEQRRVYALTGCEAVELPAKRERN